MSLKQRILKYIKTQNRLVPSGEIQRRAMDVGYSAANATRRLRELQNEGELDVVYERGHAHYRASDKIDNMEWWRQLETSN